MEACRLAVQQAATPRPAVVAAPAVMVQNPTIAVAEPRALSILDENDMGALKSDCGQLPGSGLHVERGKNVCSHHTGMEFFGFDCTGTYWVWLARTGYITVGHDRGVLLEHAAALVGEYGWLDRRWRDLLHCDLRPRDYRGVPLAAVAGLMWQARSCRPT